MKNVLLLAVLSLSGASQACTMSQLGYSVGSIQAVMGSLKNHDATIKKIEPDLRSNVIAVELEKSDKCVRQYFEVQLGASCDFKVSRGLHAERCD